jgi:hypothetical protein
MQIGFHVSSLHLTALNIDISKNYMSMAFSLEIYKNSTYTQSAQHEIGVFGRCQLRKSFDRNDWTERERESNQKLS